MKDNNHPPKFATGFLRWFCAPQFLEEIEGDLSELYYERVTQRGKWQADFAYILDITKVFRPFALKICNEPNLIYTMETKKNTSIDLRYKYSLFLSLGLLVSVAITTMAFEWKSYDNDIIIDLPKGNIVDDPVILIPASVQKPPTPKVKEIKIVEVDTEEEILVDNLLDFDLTSVNVHEVPDIKFEEPEDEETDKTFLFVEDEPYFEGGIQAFYKYISKNMKYPRQAARGQVEGKVYLSFVINTDGKITDVSVLKGIGSGCDEEAMRVLENAPLWHPGKQRGRAVKVRMQLPIIFKLN